MGHYDSLRGGPSKTEIRLRHEAYEAKQAKQLRDDISDEEIRSYLVELHECDTDTNICLDRHAKDVVYDTDDFAAAEQLVERDVYEDAYQVLPMTDRGEQLKKMCYDEGWTRYRMGSHPLTDEGIEAMLDGDVERTNNPTWDESRARKWHKHD